MMLLAKRQNLERESIRLDLACPFSQAVLNSESQKHPCPGWVVVDLFCLQGSWLILGLGSAWRRGCTFLRGRSKLVCF